MQKKKVFKVEDSNIEGIGTEEDKLARKNAAKTEKAWTKVKKNKTGFYVWRIEKFKVKTNMEAKTGSFYDDDSYIVLNVYKNAETDAIGMDVHFWLGATTSQDEQGTAAYKTVELDDYLDGLPIQHRECSGFESRLFLGYFKQIRLQTGGVDSGFNHVEPEAFVPRLLHIKGKKNIRVVQLDIKLSNLNSGDVFVLDTGLILYQYQGIKCGKNEKVQAGKLLQMIDDERKGKPEKVVFAQSDKPDDDIGKFWSYFQDDLGKDEYKEGEIVSVEKCKELFAAVDKGVGGCDAAWEKKSDKSLFQLSDSSGELKFTQVAKGKISRDLLDSKDVFVFDVGREIFVWIGSGASKQESTKAMSYATDYLTKYNRPLQLPVTRILESSDCQQFNNAFDS